VLVKKRRRRAPLIDVPEVGDINIIIVLLLLIFIRILILRLFLLCRNPPPTSLLGVCVIASEGGQKAERES